MTTRRAGLTLIEAMLAMVIATGLVVVLSIAVSRLFRANQVAQEHVQTVTTLGRLGEQFRRDAHAASGVMVEAQGANQLQISENDGPRIVYQIIPGGVERTSSEGEKVVQRETYLLPGMQPLAWEHAKEDRHLSLHIGRLANRETLNEKLSGQFTILAALASHPEIPAP